MEADRQPAGDRSCQAGAVRGFQWRQVSSASASVPKPIGSPDALRQSLPASPLSDEDSRRPLHVELVSDSSRLAALHGSWNAVVERSSRPSVFLAHEWFEAAWQWRQQTARLYVLCLFRGAGLNAVLPLVLANGEAGSPRTLQFLTCLLYTSPSPRD